MVSRSRSIRQEGNLSPYCLLYAFGLLLHVGCVTKSVYQKVSGIDSGSGYFYPLNYWVNHLVFMGYQPFAVYLRADNIFGEYYKVILCNHDLYPFH